MQKQALQSGNSTFRQCFSLDGLPLFSLSTAFLLILSLPLAALARDVNWASLNLSSQQETQLNQLEDNWEKTHDEVAAQIDRDTDELRQILPTGDTQRIRQLQTRITMNKMYLMNQSMETFLKKRDMLSPDQRQKLQKMLPGRGE